VNPRQNALAKLVCALDAVRQAFARHDVEDAFYALSDAHGWALTAGNPWTAELGDMAQEVGSATHTMRDVEEKFDALFPDDESEGG
jgi:hypothetical protein